MDKAKSVQNTITTAAPKRASAHDIWQTLQSRQQIPTIIRGTIIALRRSIVLLAKRTERAGKNRHIQPLAGSERAFGDALREIRKERSVSQEQLALVSGLDRTYVSLIERGVQSPTIRSVVKLATVLGVKPSEIIIRMEALNSRLDSLRRPR